MMEIKFSQWVNEEGRMKLQSIGLLVQEFFGLIVEKIEARNPH